jgi:hypothetical protein
MLDTFDGIVIRASNSAVDMPSIRKQYAIWKNIEKTMKTIVRDDGTLKEAKLRSFLKNPVNVERLQDAMQTVQSNFPTNQNVAAQLHQVARRFEQVNSLLRKNSTDELLRLGGLGGGFLAVGPGAFAAIPIVKPELYLAMLDKAAEHAPRVANALTSPMAKRAYDTLVTSLSLELRNEKAYASLERTLADRADLHMGVAEQYKDQPAVAAAVSNQLNKSLDAIQAAMPKARASVLNPGKTRKPTEEDIRRLAMKIASIVAPHIGNPKHVQEAYENHFKVIAEQNPSLYQQYAGAYGIQQIYAQKEDKGPTKVEGVEVPQTQTSRISSK